MAQIEDPPAGAAESRLMTTLAILGALILVFVLDAFWDDWADQCEIDEGWP